MTPEQLQELKLQIPSQIKVSNLVNQTPRSLLVGTDGYDNAFHVYLAAGSQNELCIHVLVWRTELPQTHGEAQTQRERIVKYTVGSTVDGRECIPFGVQWGGEYGRINPERSDYEFSQLLIQHGIKIPFLPHDQYWNPERSRFYAPGSLFYGPTVGYNSGRYFIVTTLHESNS